MASERFLPQYVNTDLHPSLMPPEAATFIKNLVYSLEDGSDSRDGSGQTGVYKPMQSVVEYISQSVLLPGNNHPIGYLSIKETNELIVWMYNSIGNHAIYAINGNDGTVSIVDKGSHFNFQLNPTHFIHVGGSAYNIVYVNNPNTGEQEKRTFISFTDGYNPQGFICKEDAQATYGYDRELYPFFNGDYNPALLRRLGVPTPEDCIEVIEVPLGEDERALTNRIALDTWQFRVRYYDVWGRPSEFGVISDLYVPGGGVCFQSDSRCLDLVFNAPHPSIDQVEIAYRNCNSQQWYTAKVIDLYNGSPFGKWWERERNPDVNYNGETGKITYRFCAHEGCNPIAPEETNRAMNPMPMTSFGAGNIGDVIALSNNKYGFNPFPLELRNAITHTVETPSDTSTNEFRNITVWAEIRNIYTNYNQPIFAAQDPGFFGNNNYYHGFGAMFSGVQYRAFFAYKQYFVNNLQKGFVGYLAGTEYYVISKQYFLSRTGELTEITDFTENGLRQFFRKGPLNITLPIAEGVFLQKFEFTNIPKGTYVFRLASHSTDPTTNSGYQQTSTYTTDVRNFLPLNYTNPIGGQKYNKKELTINVCEGNYDGWNAGDILRVSDLTHDRTTLVAGYVKNTNEPGKVQYGVELLRINLLPPGTSGAGAVVGYTDHNGFYFMSGETIGSQNYQYIISGFCNCQLVQLIRNNSGSADELYVQNYFLNEGQGPQNSLNTCPDYENQPCNYIQVKGRVVLCGSSSPVKGISVVLERGGTAVTDGNGEFTIIAHDDVTNSQRIDNLHFFSSGGCDFDGCDGGCIPSLQVTIQRCNSCEERIVTVNNTEVSYRMERGLLSDSTRKWGVVGKDWLGRPTYVQPLGEIIIPSVIDTGAFAPSRVKVDIPITAVFPEGIESISFYVQDAANIQDYVTWIVDKVEFIDNTGLVNDTAPAQIKIYYGSLIEYNKQNNYNTTVNWQFIPEGTTSPRIGDRVSFYLNGNGEFFDKVITAIVKYDQNGQYFLIDYTDDLEDLQANAIMRIFRPKVCDTQEPYYEVCSTIKIVDGQAVVSSFYLNAFDTYYLNRQIPVPDYDSEGGNPTTRILGVPFEHHSPSDLWGYKCHNIGRVNVENPLEAVVYNRDQVALSGALSLNGRLNYLNFFDNARKKDFSSANIGGITGVYAETGAVLVIGSVDHFIVGYNDNVARVNANGQVIAPSIDSEFGEPNTKVGKNYGCLPFDKMTIAKKDGLVHFFDSREGYVCQHNYNACLVISDNGAKSIMRSKTKTIQRYNSANNNRRYFHGIVNPMNSQYLLTDFIIGSEEYVNHERGYNFDVPETYAFGIYSKQFKGQYSFTPQLYGFLDGDRNDVQLFSFKDGIVFRHYIESGETFGIVYGERVNRVIRIVVARDSVKKKKYLSASVYCKESRYFIDQAISEAGQRTMVTNDHWRQANYGWFAPILCDLNTLYDPNRPQQTSVNRLTDGDMMYGTYLDIRFVGEIEKDTVFSALQGFVINLSPEEYSG